MCVFVFVLGGKSADHVGCRLTDVLVLRHHAGFVWHNSAFSQLIYTSTHGDA